MSQMCKKTNFSFITFLKGYNKALGVKNFLFSEAEETEEESRMTKMMTEFMDDVELSDEESEELEDDEKMKPARKSAKRKKMELIGQLENALHKSVKIIEVSVILKS